MFITSVIRFYLVEFFIIFADSIFVFFSNMHIFDYNSGDDQHVFQFS